MGRENTVPGDSDKKEERTGAAQREQRSDSNDTSDTGQQDSANKKETQEKETQTDSSSSNSRDIDNIDIEMSRNGVLYSQDDLKIRKKIDSIDQQIREYGNYIERYYDKSGKIQEHFYDAKEAQKLRYKLMEESERLHKIGWLDRSYQEWSLKWMVSKVLNAIRYILSPVYRSMCRDASALETRADLDAQYKAYVDRKTKKILEQTQEEPEKKKAPEKPLEKEHKSEEKEKKPQEPVKEPKPEKNEKEEFYESIHHTMEAQNLELKTAITFLIKKHPDKIALLEPKDITPEIANTAFQAAIAQKENFYTHNGNVDEKKKWDITKNLISKYPRMAMGFPVKEQGRMVVALALKNPEALAYMNPNAITDPKTAEKLKNAIENITKKIQENGEKPVDFNQKTIIPLLTTYREQGAVPALLEQMSQIFGKEYLQSLTESISEPEKEPELKPEREPEPEPEREPDKKTELEPIQDVSDGFNPMTFEELGNQIPYDIPEQPPIPWSEQPVFYDAIEEARDKYRNLMQNLYSDGMVNLKEEVMNTHPELFQKLPPHDKTIDAIIAAVSRDISNMKYVPESEQLPEYIEREELKNKIMTQACNNVLAESRATGKQPMEILRGQICKQTANDTLESNQMKKELRNKGFELNQIRQQELQNQYQH